MANTLNNTVLKAKDAASAVIDGLKNDTRQGMRQIEGLQTPLERFGKQIRDMQLLNNRWDKCGQYTKVLVDSEYLIQSEFPIASYKDASPVRFDVTINTNVDDKPLKKVEKVTSTRKPKERLKK